jgi:hypothetical protein
LPLDYRQQYIAVCDFHALDISCQIAKQSGCYFHTFKRRPLAQAGSKKSLEVQRSETAGQEDSEKRSVLTQGTSDNRQSVDQFHDSPAETAARGKIT